MAAGLLVQPEALPFAGKLSALVAAFGVVVFMMDRKGFINAGTAGFVAVADAGLIAIALAKFGSLDQFGFVTLLPLLWATRRHSANPAAMAPLVASTVLVGSNLYGGAGFTTPLLIQAVCILSLGLLANQSREIVQIRTVFEPAPAAVSGNPAESPAEFLEVRENYRSLRDHTKEIERKSRRDRSAVQLFESLGQGGELAYAALARKFKEITGAQGLTLYTITDIGHRMVVQSAQGEVPEQIQTSAFDIPSDAGDGQIRHRVDKMLLALRDTDQPVQCASVLLKDRGRMVGMVCLFHSNVKLLEESVDRATEASEVLAGLVHAQMERDEERRRLREAEVLYAVASASAGADTPQSVAARVVRELVDVLRVDGISVMVLDQGEALPLVTQGHCPRLIDAMSFAEGPGVAGWLKIGAPELAILDTFGDARLAKEDALKKRIGSMVVLPIQFGSEPYGLLVAMTQRVQGIDGGRLETLRVVAAELSQAMARLTTDHRDPEGLMTPGEFHEMVSRHSGCLVYLEVLRRDDLVERFGAPAVDIATRKFASRMRSRLPAGGALCRRDEGDYIVFLRDMDETFARSWANDAAASASMIGITTPDGRARIPLALKAKVAAIEQQFDQFSAENVAS